MTIEESQSTVTPTVSCVVVNYNTREQTCEFLRSLLHVSQGVTIEVIVVDNGSRDGSVAAFRAEFPLVTVVDAGENLGFARGVNVGAGVAKGRYLLLLNPDMIALPGSIQAIVTFADGHPNYGIYGGRTLKRNGTLEPSSCWGAPTIWSLLMFASMLSTIFSRSMIFDPESLGSWRRDTVREVDVVTGCLLLIRRNLFHEVGRMDEDYFLYGEDAEFSLRCRQLGWPAVVVPTAEMVHDVGGSAESSGAKTCMVLAGKVTMFRKLWSTPRAVLGTRLLVVGTGLRAFLERILRRPGAWTMAWRRRADWWIGYPRARQTLFGLPVNRSQK